MVANKPASVSQNRLEAIKNRMIRLTETGVNLIASIEEGVGISTRSFADGLGVHIELARELLRDFETCASSPEPVSPGVPAGTSGSRRPNLTSHAPVSKERGCCTSAHEPLLLGENVPFRTKCPIWYKNAI